MEGTQLLVERTEKREMGGGVQRKSRQVLLALTRLPVLCERCLDFSLCTYLLWGESRLTDYGNHVAALGCACPRAQPREGLWEVPE